MAHFLLVEHQLRLRPSSIISQRLGTPDLEDNLFLYFLYLLEAAHIPWLMASSHFQSSVLSGLFQVASSDTSLLLPVSTFKDSHDYIESHWMM